MDFMGLFGAVVAVLIHPASASKLHGQTICRSGTQRPCYKLSYIQDSRRRLTFEEARRACRSDGGELLSIETESEQRLMESFIKRLQPGDGDFWIGLHRGLQRHAVGAAGPACPPQYYWLDGSKAGFRNWRWDEPPCDGEPCVALYHRPSAPPDGARFPFRWHDDSCGAKNNFVCKYREEKAPVLTEGNPDNAAPVPSLSPASFSTTESAERIKIGAPESSDHDLNTSYILYATIPALLLLMFAAAGFLCYRHRVRRRKTESEIYSSRSKAWTSAAAPPCPVQGPYAFSDVTKLTHSALHGSSPADILAEYSRPAPHNSQCDDYENVSCTVRQSGFVTNDIYETCRPASRRRPSQTGWVENEIYG